MKRHITIITGKKTDAGNSPGSLVTRAVKTRHSRHSAALKIGGLFMPGVQLEGPVRIFAAHVDDGRLLSIVGHDS